MNRILSIAFLLASLPAGAAQVLVGKPDDTLAANVSRTEPTLIRIDGHRVRRIFGAEGEFSITADKEAGTAYVKPSTDRSVISLFVSDERGRTWKLLLALKDGPSETITIKPRRNEMLVAGRDEPRNRAIKRAIQAMAGGGEGEFDVREVNEVVPLWNEALFVLKRIAEGALRAEKYQLTNTSQAPMVIDERELYRRRVLAIAVGNPSLKPGDTTEVIVVLEPIDE